MINFLYNISSYIPTIISLLTFINIWVGIFNWLLIVSDVQSRNKMIDFPLLKFDQCSRNMRTYNYESVKNAISKSEYKEKLRSNTHFDELNKIKIFQVLIIFIINLFINLIVNNIITFICVLAYGLFIYFIYDYRKKIDWKWFNNLFWKPKKYKEMRL